jgi:hypothetical protein
MPTEAEDLTQSAINDGAQIPAEQIRERAYDIWDRNHRPNGYEVEFWLLAERELKAERAAMTSQGR